ncbi:Flavin-dependent oxidoreductase, luciferase family (includes alkanesulfonate monooxygenase SsuD and methylene tetrahydromethanopterin reductase) [Microlunatus sagamiharensis]|uniref:Flavin-dependent oxidoreductase, luciferase family (Includes alkanesulfonate monooxygenase SsuD and methylene tetrahydromethanopterin reductase) n=1 Tax=Microlunatus sagamiharensis TaxID=546874 RepID=A0A1H2MLK2_9ACTN|nr:LLM class flavin-dependent oxidoreductase [Microlunatus sagamiharensis]SDU93992.1 Flavin-dependent oxidoreductase, luciferase family (includes alkanesulfonate monooxygenase SsuD and methylene tetrahydromethanopterin reductase) [Microlunatus sagamiharensis]
MTKRGLFLPAFDPLADPRVFADVAMQAEEAGWDGIFVWDHLLYADPVTEIADPWICLAAAAMVTERIELGIMVTPLSRRRPHVVAKQAATLDRLSDGRLILGFGLGDDGGGRDGGGGELSAFGETVDPKTRATMLDEGLEVLTGLLSGERVDHDGPHHKAAGVTFLPPATRPGGIPIWIGGRWPNKPPQRRAARFDGYFVIGLQGPEDVAEARTAIDAARSAAGRESEPIELVVQVTADTDAKPWADAGASWVLTQVGPYRMELNSVHVALSAQL